MMPRPRFLQVHTLTSYAAALLNRDDSWQAKRLPYGGAVRTRISSQCLKRHWRVADDAHAFDRIDGATAAYRSRELVTRRVIAPLRESFPEDVVAAIEAEFQWAVYGFRGNEKKNRQPLLFGEPELRWLEKQAETLARKANGDAEAASDAAAAWREGFRTNIRAMRESVSLPAGLASALFGRMVTSDPGANIAAPVHVAHAFTVHKEEAEPDYFTAVDDLAGDEPGVDMIDETELTSGLFYGYVVVDLPGLLENLGGDTSMAGHLLRHFVYLIAEVSPGAKLGSTAPYGRASLMLLEAGERQPRSLAEAYRTPCYPRLDAAIAVLTDHLAVLDEAYATGEERRVMSLMSLSNGGAIPGAERGSLADLAEWAGTLPERTDT